MQIPQCHLVERVIGLKINKEVQNMEILLKLSLRRRKIELDHKLKVEKVHN